MVNVYVDLDGTLLDSRLDDKYKAISTQYGKGFADDWYESTYYDTLELNLALWCRLLVLKEEGASIVAWTNRRESKADMTFSNLAKLGIMDLFSGFMFCNGQKHTMPLRDGVVFENEFDNEIECSEFNFIPTFKL
jgi:predicted secreted acid phosphatase